MNVDINLYRNENSTIEQLPATADVNIGCDNTAVVSLVVDMLLDNVQTTSDSNISQMGKFVKSFIYNYKRIESSTHYEMQKCEN